MPGRRIEMRKLKEVLRLKLTAKLSNRKIALITGVGKSAVSKHVKRAQELGLDWGRIEPMASPMEIGNAGLEFHRPALWL